MPSKPPYDRAIALACALSTFRTRWLSTECAKCGTSIQAVKMLLQEQPGRMSDTLADAVVRLRCHGCRQRPCKVYLLETHYAGLREDAGGPSNKGWRLELHQD